MILPFGNRFRIGAGLVLFGIALLLGSNGEAQTVSPPETNKVVLRALVLTETGGQHGPFVDAARVWLKNFAKENRFEIEYAENTKLFNADYLARYQVLIQLNYPPYRWTPEAMSAFKDYIEHGKGGWVGFHHATLLGEFDGYPMWPWFSEFMGGIRFKNYIATFVAGDVKVEANTHPVMKGIPASFSIGREEFYTYNRSPRPNVHVLASVDENTYSPATDIKMGDHPVVWCNERVQARNVYIQMGHGADLFQNTNFTRLFSNSLLWAAGK